MATHLRLWPWTDNLNKDLHENINWICCIINSLNNSDPNKFCKITPKPMLSVYARVWDTSLLSGGYTIAQQIVQDISNVVDKAYL